MCGIFGYALARSVSKAPPPLLERAVEQLRHRGPDAEGTYTDHRGDVICAFVHTRLAIIDLSPTGKQPMTTSDGRYTITFNGEIYNYRELRDELEPLGHQFQSTSDTEVLLFGYRQWGKDLLPKLRGMFAFAIWDTTERALFLARDRLGVKPLYLAQVDGGLIFASEIRSILGTELVARRLNREALTAYLAFGSVREPLTIVEGIGLLPAGSYAELREGRLATADYWSPPLGVDTSISRAAAVDEIAHLLRESVRLRLVADVPVGIFLSGGLDSSALVALATEESRSRIRTFTITFDEAAYDEARAAQQIADRFGVDHHPMRLSAQRALDEMDQALDALDQPSADGINTYFVSKAVREAGIAVALSGIGGDELFAGYPAFRTYGLASRVAALLRLLPVARPQLDAGVRSGVRKSVALLGTRGDPFAMYATFRAMFLPDQVGRLLASSERAEPAPTGFDEAIARFAAGREGDAVAAYSAFELTNYLRNTLLRDMDVMGMAHGLEIREPLLDHRLVERLLTIPASMKLSARRKKPLLVDAVPGLPGAPARRPKMGFTLPFETWLHGPLRQWARDRLLGSDLLAPAEVSSVWSAFERGHISYSRIWTLIALFDWARRNRFGELAVSP